MLIQQPLYIKTNTVIFRGISRKKDAPPMAKNDTRNAPAPNPRLRVSAGDHVIGGRNERPTSRLEKSESMLPVSHEEVLIVDDRAGLRPAQVVETKLTRLLQEASLPVSHLQMRGILRTR
jgi:hypothetical protein